MKKLEYHPASNIFPMMSKEEADGLLKDIKKNGQRYAIELFESMILDGRNRYEACKKLGFTPETRGVDDIVKDPVAYVLTANLHRRHLTPSQRAMIASRAQEYYATEAKKRQKLSQGRGKKGVIPGSHLKDQGKSREQVGKAFDVSGASVDRATRIIERGAPELTEAVDSGELTVRMAERILELPVEEQRQIAKAPEPAKEARRILQEKKEAEYESQERKIVGVGVFRGNDAVDCLRRIPPNDPLRRDGFQIVEDYVKMHKNKKPGNNK
jgi:ParB-like chromosome segregation protein Spo0J